MVQYGIFIGPALVLIATAVALLLGARAARSVEEFRSEDHETFVRRDGQ